MRMRDVTEEVRRMLERQFGIQCDLQFYEGGKGKVYAMKEPPQLIDASIRRKIVHFGVYVGRMERDGFRLSIDGSSLVGKYARKCVADVSDEEAEAWMKGEDLEGLKFNDFDKHANCRYLILRWRGFYIGCGKVINGRIKNYVPKNRRIQV